MKRIFAIICFAIAILSVSCKKDLKNSKETESGLIIRTQFGTKLSTGEIIYTNEDCIIQVWNTNGHDVVIKSQGDALSGHAYDNTDKKSISTLLGTAGSFYKVKLDPGTYLVFAIVTRDTGIGQFAWSSKKVTVGSGEYVSLTKKFSYNAQSIAFEDWDKNP